MISDFMQHFSSLVVGFTRSFVFFESYLPFNALNISTAVSCGSMIANASPLHHQKMLGLIILSHQFSFFHHWIFSVDLLLLYTLFCEHFLESSGCCKYFCFSPPLSSFHSLHAKKAIFLNDSKTLPVLCASQIILTSFSLISVTYLKQLF